VVGESATAAKLTWGAARLEQAAVRGDRGADTGDGGRAMRYAFGTGFNRKGRRGNPIAARDSNVQQCF